MIVKLRRRGMELLSHLAAQYQMTAVAQEAFVGAYTLISHL